jgi:hypothetical protein
MNSKEHPCPDCRYPKRIDEDYCPTCPFAKLETEQKSSRWSSLFDFGGGAKPQETPRPVENPFPQIQPQQNIEPQRIEVQPNPQQPIYNPPPQYNPTPQAAPPPQNYPPPPPHNYGGRATMLPGEMPPLPKNVPRGTFNPYTQPLTETPKFKLTSIPRHTETTGQTNEYEGESVALKRSNLDKENYTISSQEHATIDNIDNKWYISNKSSLKTTYIQVNSLTEIKDGDVVLIGDRMFIFRPE